MSTFIFIILFLISGSHAACLQDSLVLKDKAIVDVRKAENAIENFQVAMSDELPEDHNLVIRLESLNLRVNADVVLVDNNLVIQIMGGMLKHHATTPDTLMLLLCHELGHFLGGPPLKSRTGWSSTEGQSDYYSGYKCARALGLDTAAFTEAALALTRIYAEVGREVVPRLDRCDEKAVNRTNYGYPGVQCRLDTMMAGWTGEERPRCWFYE